MTGRMLSVDRVAIVAVVGNEDGAHHVGAERFQGLNDVGFTIAAGGMTYWVGEAMHKTDFKDLPSGSAKTNQATKTAAANAAHRAQLLAGVDDARSEALGVGGVVRCEREELT